MRSILLVLAAATQLSAQASVEGQIFNAATGAPLKKAMVRLNGIGAPQPQAPNAPRRMPTQLAKETDDQGKFAFTNLEPGRYSLSATRTGYLRQSYGARHYNSHGVPIALAADQHMTNAVLKMSPQSVITGKAIDEDGDPVPNVQVRALRYVYSNGKRQWWQVGQGQTSDIGEFRIANLEPGRYLVATNPRNNPGMVNTTSREPLPDKPESVAASTYYPNALDSNTASPVDVGPGAELRGIDIRVRKVTAFHVRGKVVSAVAPERNNLTVMLTRKDAMGEPQSVAVVRAPDMGFDLRGVPPGSYLLHATVRMANQVMVGYEAVEVGHGHVDGVVLTLSPGREIQGVLKVAESDAQVDLSNVNVVVRPVGFLFGGAGRGKVADDRKFVVKGAIGERITANVNGIPDTCFVKSIQYGGQEVTEAGVEPNPAAMLEITLSATAGQVTGVVLDKDGKPVAAAPVVLFAKSPEPGRQPWNRYTDENGAFTFKGLKPGDYRLLAWEDVEDNAWEDPEFVKPWESRAAEVKIDPSGTQAVQVKVIAAEEMK